MWNKNENNQAHNRKTKQTMAMISPHTSHQPGALEHAIGNMMGSEEPTLLAPKKKTRADSSRNRLKNTPTKEAEGENDDERNDTSTTQTTSRTASNKN